MDPRLRPGTNHCKCGVCGEYFKCTVDGGYESDDLVRQIEAILLDEFYLPGSDGVAALRSQAPEIAARIYDLFQRSVQAD